MSTITDTQGPQNPAAWLAALLREFHGPDFVEDLMGWYGEKLRLYAAAHFTDGMEASTEELYALISAAMHECDQSFQRGYAAGLAGAGVSHLKPSKVDSA